MSVNEMDRILGAFGAAIGLPGLAFDAEGSCLLEVGALRLDLQRDAAGRRLLVSCLAAELPAGDEGRASAMARLLAANALFRGTGGATIGVPAGSGAVVLAREFTLAELGEGALKPGLEAFLAAAEGLPALLAAEPDRRPDIDPSHTMIRV